MVRQAIAETSRFGAIQYDCALAVEMSSGFLLVEVIEDGCECIAALEFLGWNIAPGVHVHNEMRIFGKQSHLALCIPAVGTMRIRVH
jgi:hypothetical protein